MLGLYVVMVASIFFVECKDLHVNVLSRDL